MAQQFTTEAVVRLKDELSGPLKGLAAAAQSLEKSLASSAGAAGTGMVNALDKNLVAMQSRVSAFQAAIGAAALAAATASAAAMRKIFDDGFKFSEATTKMQMFTDASGAQLRKLQQEALYNKVGMSPTEYLKASTESMKAGIAPEFASAGARYGAMYGQMAGISAGQGTEQLIQLASMMRTFRDEAGKPVPLEGIKTMEQFTAGMETAFGRLIHLNKESPGGMRDSFQFLKYSSPIALGLGVPIEQQLAFGIVAARAGLQGDEAGNLYKSVYANLVAPKGPARQALASTGIDWNKFAIVNQDQMSADSFLSGMKARTGSTDKDDEKKIRAIFDELKKTRDMDKARLSLVDTLKNSGYKNFDNDAKAGNFVKDYVSNYVKTVNILDLLIDMKKKGLDNNPGLYTNLFGKQQGGRFMALPLEFLEASRDRTKGINEKENVAKIFETWEKSLTYARGNLNRAMSSMAISLFQPFEQGLASTGNKVAAWLDGLSNKMSDGQKQATVFGAGIAGLFAGSSVLARFGLMESSLGTIVSRLSTLRNLTAAGLAVTGVVFFWDQIIQGLQTLQAFMDGFTWAAKFKDIAGDIAKVGSSLAGLGADIVKAVGGDVALEYLKKLGEAVASVFPDDWAAAGIKSANALKAAIEAIYEGIEKLRRVVRGEENLLPDVTSSSQTGASLDAQIASIQRSGVFDPRLKGLLEQRYRISGSNHRDPDTGRILYPQSGQILYEDANPFIPMPGLNPQTPAGSAKTLPGPVTGMLEPRVVQVVGDVKGQAEISNKVTVTVDPSPNFLTRIKNDAVNAVMAIHGNVNNVGRTMSGSQGTSKPPTGSTMDGF